MLTVAQPESSDIWLPVMFYNGYRFVISWHVKIFPTDNYASFNLIIGRLFNVHPNYIQSYLLETDVPGATSPHLYKWKATISHWTDFSLVTQQKNCCFLIVLRPPQFAGHRNPMMDARFMKWVQYWHRKRLAATTNMVSVGVNGDMRTNASGVQIQENQESPKVKTQSGVCEECNNVGAGADNEFHHCKLDAIVVDGGYKTKFGPIECKRRTEPEVTEPSNEQTGLYSLFGPMPGVDSILLALRQWVEDEHMDFPSVVE